jgi:lipocalin-like protein
MSAEIRQRLVGTWRLVSYDTTSEGERRGQPYGAAVGRLEYDDHGNMSGQVMRPDRARVEVNGTIQQVRAAYIGYIAYFGTYEVADDGRSVVHHVEGALNPAWVGGRQVRSLRFDSDRLILSAQVQKNDAELVVHTLTWERC